MRDKKFGVDQQLVLGLVRRFPGCSHNFVAWVMLGGGVQGGGPSGRADASFGMMVKAMSAYKRLNELVSAGVLVKRAGAAFVVPGTSSDGYWLTAASGSIADGVVRVSGSDAAQGVYGDSHRPVEVKQGVASAASAARNISDMMKELE